MSSRVTHISPAMFGSGGYWGGGERYPLELARAQSAFVPTRLVSFGDRARRFRLGALEIHVLPTRINLRGSSLNPISELLALEVAGADVLHVHQMWTAVTDLVALTGAALRKPVFVTDHGGSAPNLNSYVDTTRFVRRHLAVSAFSASMSPEYSDRYSVIYGGADVERFCPGPEPRTRKVVYVGRLLPHKGIHDLIDAVDASMPLEIYGRPYDPAYRRELGRKAQDKPITFFESASDAEIVAALRSARVSVLPSVHTSPYGGPYAKTELLGLTLIEAMACATPAIASDAASLPEVVADGETGFIFPAGNVSRLRECLRRIWTDDGLWERMSVAAKARVHEQFTWSRTAQRALEAYGL